MKVWLKYCKGVCVCLASLISDSHFFYMILVSLLPISQVSYSKPIKAVVINDF